MSEEGEQNKKSDFSQYMTNELAHHYLLGESIFIFRGIRSDFRCFISIFDKILYANRTAPDGMPHSAASHQGLCCLPMSHKENARLI